MDEGVFATEIFKENLKGRKLPTTKKEKTHDIPIMDRRFNNRCNGLGLD